MPWLYLAIIAPALAPERGAGAEWESVCRRVGGFPSFKIKNFLGLLASKVLGFKVSKFLKFQSFKDSNIFNIIERC